jgi:hypothetical protein
MVVGCLYNQIIPMMSELIKPLKSAVFTVKTLIQIVPSAS